MQDIIESRNRAMLKQGWLFGDKMSRIGHPYVDVDGEHASFIYITQGIRCVLNRLSMYYEQYPTPQSIKLPNYEAALSRCNELLNGAMRSFAPFLDQQPEWKHHIASTALVRTQDYCCIKTFCPDLPAKGAHHIDIGPGLGGHALYSLSQMESTHYALEANPWNYEAQRYFYRYLANEYGDYLDLIECDTFGLTTEQIKSEMLNKRYRIRHLPSWFSPLVPDNSIDLVSATWVLNEVNHAGILWLMSQAMRTLKRGGYMYIRDSRKLKPGRHNISYDQLLLSHGFKEAGKLEVENRVTFFGHPRVYQKTTDKSASFDDLCEEYLGKFAITVHGGDYNQNLDTMPKSS